jgi:hypothetical protein
MVEGEIMKDPMRRRTFLQSSLIGAGCLLPSIVSAQQKPAQNEHEQQNEGEEISPAEDLMREHGLLNRILLIYDHHLQLLSAKKTFDGSILVSSADVIRHFVEEYHEKLEEDYLFPRFRKAKNWCRWSRRCRFSTKLEENSPRKFANSGVLLP